MGMLTVKYPESIVTNVKDSVIVTIKDEGDTPEIKVGIMCLDVTDNDSYNFIQTEELTEFGVGVHPYGAIIYTISDNAEDAAYLDLMYKGKLYRSSAKLELASFPSDIKGFTFTPVNS